MITIRYERFGRSREKRVCETGEDLAGVIAELMELAEAHEAIERIGVEWVGGRDAQGVAVGLASVAPSENIDALRIEAAETLILCARNEGLLYRRFMGLASRAAPIGDWARLLEAYQRRLVRTEGARAWTAIAAHLKPIAMIAALDLRERFLREFAEEAAYQAGRAS
jgi:hypothetical protein